MEATFKAYLAGFIDADGHISIHKVHGYYYLRVGITNRSEALLLYLQKKIGMGKIYLNEKQTQKRNATYSILVHGRQAAHLLSEIIEYLVLKREQAKIGLAFAETIKNPGVEIEIDELEKKIRLYRKIKLLNKRGPSNPHFESPNIVEIRKRNELDKLRQWQGKDSHPYLVSVRDDES